MEKAFLPDSLPWKSSPFRKVKVERILRTWYNETADCAVLQAARGWRRMRRESLPAQAHYRPETWRACGMRMTAPGQTSASVCPDIRRDLIAGADSAHPELYDRPPAARSTFI